MNLKLNIGFAAVAAMTIAAGGCGSQEKTQPAEAEPATAAIEEATEASGATVEATPAEEAAEAEAADVAKPLVEFEESETVVEAYGKTLSYGEAVTHIKRALSAQGISQDQLDATVAQIAPMALPQIAEEFVMMSALQDVAAKADIVATDEEVENEFNQMVSSLPPGFTLEMALERSGTTTNEIKKQIRESLPIKKMLDNLVGDNTPADSEVKAYYDENIESFKTPEQIRASHILVSFKPSASDEEKAEAKTKIEGLLAKLKEGADFAELASANSDCPSKANGGDLNWFGRRQMVPAFEEAAFALEDGKISDIVETQFGYHIIKKTGAREAGVTPFEEVKEMIANRLKDTKEREIVGKYFANIRSKAEFKQSEKLSKLFAPEEEEGALEIEADDEAEANPEAEEPAEVAPKAEKPAEAAPEAEKPAEAAPEAEKPAEAAPEATSQAEQPAEA